jgi:transcriptional regulator with XRE-family HTH domain
MTDASAQRFYERWKVRARDYGLERPDANLPAFPRNRFFALDVLGAFDAIWAILGPPHPLEAAPIGGRERGESREYDLIEGGQERFEAGTEPLPIDHELVAGDWDREWDGHSKFWGGTGVGTGPRARPQATRHYAIFPDVQQRLAAAEAYVDPETLVSSLPPILTDAERAEVAIQSAIEGAARMAMGEEDGRPRKLRFTPPEVIRKIEELVSEVGKRGAAAGLQLRLGTLTSVRSGKRQASIDLQQRVHNLYGEVFGGPVPTLKKYKRRKPPKPLAALKALLEELGRKKLAKRLKTSTGQLGNWLTGRSMGKGKRRKRYKISEESARKILTLYDQVIRQIEVPPLPPELNWPDVIRTLIARAQDAGSPKRHAIENVARSLGMKTDGHLRLLLSGEYMPKLRTKRRLEKALRGETKIEVHVTQTGLPAVPATPAARSDLEFVLERMSQNKLSKRIGTSRGTIQNWIKGLHQPSPAMQAKLAEVAEELKDVPPDPKKGMRPGKTAAAPFVRPPSTPDDVVLAVKLIHATLGAKAAAEALGVSKGTWRQWATGKLKEGRRRWIPGARWGEIMGAALQIDPTFPAPHPDALHARAVVHAGIVYLYERAGRQKAAEILGMHPNEIAAIMTSPELPPPEVAERIHQAASRTYKASELGREVRRGHKRKVSDVVEGWREMLRELRGRFRSNNALREALRSHGYVPSSPLLRRVIETDEGFVEHKGQRAIAALYAAVAEAV